MSSPRTRRISSSLTESRSIPSKLAVPEISVFSAWVRPRMVSAVTLLPQPDSPTMPSVSPGSIENETPSTAWTTPSSLVEADPQVRDVEQVSHQ